MSKNTQGSIFRQQEQLVKGPEIVVHLTGLSKGKQLVWMKNIACQFLEKARNYNGNFIFYYMSERN